jgi:hypothetical protein
MKYGVAICLLLLFALTCLLLSMPLPPEKPAISLTNVLKPPDCLGPSTPTVVGSVLKFHVPQAITVHASDSPDATIYWIKGPSDRERLEIGEGPLGFLGKLPSL